MGIRISADQCYKDVNVQRYTSVTMGCPISEKWLRSTWVAHNLCVGLCSMYRRLTK